MASKSKSHREYYRPSKFLTPESPKPTFRAMSVGDLGRNAKKRLGKEFKSTMTRQQFQEARRHAQREARRERQESPRQ